MEIVLALVAVCLAIAFGLYALTRKPAVAPDEEAIRAKISTTYESEIAALKAELELTRQNAASNDTRWQQALDAARREVADERKAHQATMADKARIAGELQTAQTLLDSTRAQARKDEERRQEMFQTELNLAREQMRGQFEKEMTERTEALKAANNEQMEAVVRPLKHELETLKALVERSKTDQTSATERLEASIKAVFEHDKERDKTTQSLADALRNRGKVQGDWGEQVLENILRDSGLREGEEFEKQVNVKTEQGEDVRPDIIVKSANGSRIIIDSKVSLTAYTDYVGAETDEERKAAIKANYDSIWKHVTELADMKYSARVEGALPMVLMFVPNEGSYILAMNKDPQLGAKAYQKGVLIINPTNLMVVLRLMFLTWQNTRQEKNNREILAAAAKIYEKYSTFADGYIRLGNQINTARSTYEEGLGQLREGRGNLSRQLEGLLQYGVTTKKRISEQAQSLYIEE